MEELPDEMFMGVLEHLGPTALNAASLVSKRWHSLATEPSLFRLQVLEGLQPGEDASVRSEGEGGPENEPSETHCSENAQQESEAASEESNSARNTSEPRADSQTGEAGDEGETEALPGRALLPEAEMRGPYDIYCTYAGPKRARVPILSQLAPSVPAEDWASIYQQLLTLDDEVAYEDVIGRGISASSTDDQPDDQSIDKTLSPDGFWSSSGAPDENSSEELLYELRGLALVFAVDIKPFQARFQMGIPTYASKTVEVEFSLDSKEWQGFPEHRLANVGAMQRLSTAPDAICAKYLRIKLHGRCSRQPSDWLFYTVLERVMACGILVKDLPDNGLKRALLPLDPSLTMATQPIMGTAVRQNHRILYESTAMVFSALNYLFRHHRWKAMAVWCKLHPSHVQERQLLLAANRQKGTTPQQRDFLDTLFDPKFCLSSLVPEEIAYLRELHSRGELHSENARCFVMEHF